MFISSLDSMDLKTRVLREIMRYIRSMDLERDNKLPKEEDFCKILGTSRITLRSALDELAALGIVFRRHGHGTFVNVRSLDIKTSFAFAMDLYELIHWSGYTPSVYLCGVTRMTESETIGKVLELQPEEPVFHVRKVFHAGEHFCAYLEDSLPVKLIQESAHLSFEEPLFPQLDQELGIHLSWDKVELGAALSTDLSIDPALLKDLTGGPHPLLLVEGCIYDEKDRPVMYSREYINPQLIHYIQIRQRRAALSALLSEA